MHPIGSYNNLKDSLPKARKKKEERDDKMKDERQEKILEYIEAYPGQTSYSLNKVFHYNLRYISDLLKDLEENGLIKLEKKTENNRTKLVASPLTVNDVTWDSFSETIVNDPVIQLLIQKTMNGGGSVWIHKSDGNIIELRPPT